VEQEKVDRGGTSNDNVAVRSDRRDRAGKTEALRPPNRGAVAPRISLGVRTHGRDAAGAVDCQGIEEGVTPWRRPLSVLPPNFGSVGRRELHDGCFKEISFVAYRARNVHVPRAVTDDLSIVR